MSHERAEGALDVFVSYAHEDEDLYDELRKHLASLEREGKIRAWHDRAVRAGEPWADKIDYHLSASELILLLVSPDFMASKYCSEVEVPQALDRHRAGSARVVPVILRPVNWSREPFSDLQSLPRDARPVTSWPDRDEAFLDVERGLRAVIDAELERRRSPAPPPSSRPPAARVSAAPRPSEALAESRAVEGDAGSAGGGMLARLDRRAWAALAVLAVISALALSQLSSHEPAQVSPPEQGFLVGNEAGWNNPQIGDELRVTTESITVYRQTIEEPEHIAGYWQKGTRARIEGKRFGAATGGEWLECTRVD